MLTLVDETDLTNMLSWVDSPYDIFQWSGGSLEYPLTIEQLRRYALDDSRNHRAYKYVDATQRMQGYIELCNIDLRNDSGSLSRVIVAPEKRNCGIGRKMVAAVLEKGFEEFKLNRITLHVFESNQRAIRCYEHVGFKSEGLLRQVYKHNSTYWNVYLMSVLRSDYQDGASSVF